MPVGYAFWPNHSTSVVDSMNQYSRLNCYAIPVNMIEPENNQYDTPNQSKRDRPNQCTSSVNVIDPTNVPVQ